MSKADRRGIYFRNISEQRPNQVRSKRGVGIIQKALEHGKLLVFIFKRKQGLS